MHCLVYVAIENTYMVVKWQFPLVTYSVDITVGIADILTSKAIPFTIYG